MEDFIMFCKNCGKEIAEGTVCPACGTNNIVVSAKANKKHISIMLVTIAIAFLMTFGLLFFSKNNKSLTAYCFDKDYKSFFGLTLKEINDKTNDYFKDDADNISDDGKSITFELGKNDKLFNRKIDLGEKYDISLTLKFNDSNLLEDIKYRIDEPSKSNINSNSVDLTEYIVKQLKEKTLMKYEYRWSDVTGHNFENDNYDKILVNCAVTFDEVSGQFKNDYPVYIEFLKMKN